MIYFINNPAAQTTNYVCPDQATIDAGQQDGYIGIYSIGNQDDANQILLANQQAWLQQNAALFSVNLQTLVNGGVVWVPIDLNAEPNNLDRVYQILNVPNGFYTEAIGLENAKNTLINIKVNYLAFSNLSGYVAYETWPPFRRPKLSQV